MVGLSLLDLGLLNEWNEKIEWLSMQNMRQIIGGKDMMRGASTRGALWLDVLAPSTHYGRGILYFDWSNLIM